MRIYINWKKVILVAIDIVLAIYITFAITSWNKPSDAPRVCTKVEINIEDENENGFLKTAEVKNLLQKKGLYPLSKRVSDINVRDIERELCNTAFVKTADCYVSENGHVNISLTQRTPILRVKAQNGDDYYIDDNGGVMPNSQYTSDMIIATGEITRTYACRYLSIMAKYVMESDLWRNQIEQINVLHDKTIEIVPRVGDHVINLGMMPVINDKEQRKEKVTEFIELQLHRLDLFYKYGLSEAGWNKYSYISLEFANQVICTRPEKHKKIFEPTAVEEEIKQPAEANSDNTETQQEPDKVKKVEAQPQPTKKTEEKDDKKTVKTPAKVETKTTTSAKKESSKAAATPKKTDKKKQ